MNTFNIIIPKAPDWREEQPILGQFKSTAKNGLDVTEELSPKQQFDKEELAKIHNAIRYTQAIYPELSKVRHPDDEK